MLSFLGNLYNKLPIMRKLDDEDLDILNDDDGEQSTSSQTSVIIQESSSTLCPDIDDNGQVVSARESLSDVAPDIPFSDDSSSIFQHVVPPTETINSSSSRSSSTSSSTSSSIIAPSSTKSKIQWNVEEAGKLLLYRTWTIWYDEGAPFGVTGKHWQSNIETVGTFATIKDFWRYWNNLIPVIEMADGGNLRLFVSGVKPMWEDSKNVHGGKHTIRVPKDKTATIWQNLVLAVIGEQLEIGDDLCGVELCIRAKTNKISLWNSDADNEDEIKKQHLRIRDVLELESFMHLKYERHTKRLLSHEKTLLKIKEKGEKQTQNQQLQLPFHRRSQSQIISHSSIKNVSPIQIVASHHKRSGSGSGVTSFTSQQQQQQLRQGMNNSYNKNHKTMDGTGTLTLTPRPTNDTNDGFTLISSAKHRQLVPDKGLPHHRRMKSEPVVSHAPSTPRPTLSPIIKMSSGGSQNQ